jgi:hypothetical protein
MECMSDHTIDNIQFLLYVYSKQLRWSLRLATKVSVYINYLYSKESTQVVTNMSTFICEHLSMPW